MLIKFLNYDLSPIYGNPSFRWSLPTEAGPGEWMPEVPTEMCVSGYHACALEHAIFWISPVAFEVELGGEIINGRGKLCASRARLVRRLEHWTVASMTWFACDCAARVAHLSLEARACVETTRRFLRGEATREELEEARGAAWAARVGARVGARGAARGAALAALAAQDAARAALVALVAGETQDAARMARAAGEARAALATSVDAAGAALATSVEAEELQLHIERLHLYLTTPLAEITPMEIKE